MGMTVTNQNHIHIEIKSRLNSGNTSSHPISKNLKKHQIAHNYNFTFCFVW